MHYKTDEAVEVLLVAARLLNPVSAFGSLLQLSNNCLVFLLKYLIIRENKRRTQ